jgi:hypothetical protein
VASFSSEQIEQVNVGIAGGRSAGLLEDVAARGSALVILVDEVGAGVGFGVATLRPVVSLSLAGGSSLMSTDGGCSLLLFCSTGLLSGFCAGLLEIF